MVLDHNKIAIINTEAKNFETAAAYYLSSAHLHSAHIRTDPNEYDIEDTLAKTDGKDSLAPTRFRRWLVSGMAAKHFLEAALCFRVSDNMERCQALSNHARLFFYDILSNESGGMYAPRKGLYHEIVGDCTLVGDLGDPEPHYAAAQEYYREVEGDLSWSMEDDFDDTMQFVLELIDSIDYPLSDDTREKMYRLSLEHRILFKRDHFSSLIKEIVENGGWESWMTVSADEIEHSEPSSRGVSDLETKPMENWKTFARQMRRKGFPSIAGAYYIATAHGLLFFVRRSVDTAIPGESLPRKITDPEVLGPALTQLLAGCLCFRLAGKPDRAVAMSRHGAIFLDDLLEHERDAFEQARVGLGHELLGDLALVSGRSEGTDHYTAARAQYQQCATDHQHRTDRDFEDTLAYVFELDSDDELDTSLETLREAPLEDRIAFKQQHLPTIVTRVLETGNWNSKRY